MACRGAAAGRAAWRTSCCSTPSARPGNGVRHPATFTSLKLRWRDGVPRRCGTAGPTAAGVDRVGRLEFAAWQDVFEGLAFACSDGAGRCAVLRGVTTPYTGGVRHDGWAPAQLFAQGAIAASRELKGRGAYEALGGVLAPLRPKRIPTRVGGLRVDLPGGTASAPREIVPPYRHTR